MTASGLDVYSLGAKFGKVLLVVALGLWLGIGLTGCQQSAQVPDQVAPTAAPPAPVTPAEPATTTKPAEGDMTTITLVTDKGDIKLQLFDEDTPITAGSFLLLSEEGFYNGITFHRVEPGFVIQGGDPKGNGTGGPGFTIPDEVRPNLKHDRGMLSMAKTSAPNTGGSQFFVCLGGPNVTGHLDMKHTVFGKVLEGMDVVDQIRKGDKILEARVDTVSPHAQAARDAAKAGRVPN